MHDWRRNKREVYDWRRDKEEGGVCWRRDKGRRLAHAHLLAHSGGEQALALTTIPQHEALVFDHALI